MKKAGETAVKLGQIVGGYRVVRPDELGASGARYVVDGAEGRPAVLRLLGGVNAKDAVELARRLVAITGSPGSARVPILDAGWEPALERLYVVQPVLDGVPLEQTLQRVGALAPGVATRIFCQIARDLAEAHRTGLVHLSLRPAAIFLERDDKGFTVLIDDYGLPPSSLEPSNPAPEQVARGRVDHRADLWGLGSIYYAMLTGFLPGAPLTPGAPARSEIPWIQDVAPWIPSRVAEAVHGLLVADPRLRCPTAEEALRLLQPRAGGTLRLNADMITGIRKEQRALRASPGRRPASWAQVLQRPDPEGESDHLLGCTIGDDLRIVRLLGRGGMAAVYEALAPTGPVAVKIILGQQGDESATLMPMVARRLVREAKAAAAIASPHVVRVLDAGSDATIGKPYVVMELLRGQSLDAAIRERGPLASAPIARLFVQACHGLSAAHQLGIVHRDVKPANLFLHEAPGGELVLKICDFGVAKVATAIDAASSELTRSGTILGSPRYMSPEQAKDPRLADQRADIWGLAASLYEAVSGRQIWEGCDGLIELMQTLTSGEVEPLSRVAPWIAPGLAEVIHRGLRRNPRERYRDALELAAALEPFASATVEVLPRAVTRPALPRGPERAAPGVEGPTLPDGAPPPRRRARPERPSRWRWIAWALVFATSGYGAATLARADRDTWRIPVVPATLEVVAGGKRLPVGADGTVVLEGSPGEIVRIFLRDGERSTTTDVVMARGGRTIPARLELGAEDGAP